MKKHIFLLALLVICFSCKKESQETIPSKRVNYFDLVRPEFNGDLAYKTTAYVEQFWRVVGNTGFNNSIHKIVEELEKSGYILEENATEDNRLTYRIETRKLDSPTWEPVDASLSINGGKTLLDFSTNRNMICQNSASTPTEGIIADVIYIKNIEELKNTNVEEKIVFAEVHPRALYQKAIIKGKALGILTYSNPDYLQPKKNKTSIQFRRIPIQDNTKHWGIALSYDAKEQLKEALNNGNVSANVKINTKIYQSEELTVVANVKGSAYPNKSLVFSAHVQEPGANDNATGVGTQLEMASITSKLITSGKIDAKRTLTFLWGDEIISTRRYVKEIDNSKTIKWGISLDMVGENTDKTGGSFLIEKMPDPSAIWTRGNDKHTEWGGKQLRKKDMTPHYLNDFIINTFKEQGKFANWEVNTNPFEGGSDHTPFLRADIPGLLLWHFTDQFYHTDNDRLDKVSQTTMTNVGTSALVSAYTLINSDFGTALDLLDTSYNSAVSRLNIEYELSKKALSDGSDFKNEADILNTWTEWYLDTFDTLKDLDPTNNKTLNTSIKETKKKLENYSLTLLDKLKSQ